MVKNIFRSHPDSNYSPASIYHHIPCLPTWYYRWNIHVIIQSLSLIWCTKSHVLSTIQGDSSNNLFPLLLFFSSLGSISIQSFDYFSHLKEDTLILVSPLNNAPFICSPFSKTFWNFWIHCYFQFPFKPTLTLTLTPTLTPSIPLKVLKVINDRHVINFSGQFPGLSLLALTQQFSNRGDFCTWSTKYMKTFLVVSIQGIWPNNSLAPNANSAKAEKPQTASSNKQ